MSKGHRYGDQDGLLVSRSVGSPLASLANASMSPTTTSGPGLGGWLAKESHVGVIGRLVRRKSRPDLLWMWPQTPVGSLGGSSASERTRIIANTDVGLALGLANEFRERSGPFTYIRLCWFGWQLNRSDGEETGFRLHTSTVHKGPETFPVPATWYSAKPGASVTSGA
jgi:hypothetical protein